VKRSISAQNLIAYSNQYDELILNIYMARSHFAISGGETHFSVKKDLKISKITFFSVDNQKIAEWHNHFRKASDQKQGMSKV